MNRMGATRHDRKRGLGDFLPKHMRLAPRISPIPIAPKHKCFLPDLAEVLLSGPGVHRVQAGVYCSQFALRGDGGAVLKPLCVFTIQKTKLQRSEGRLWQAIS